MLGAILIAISTILLVSFTALACIVIKRQQINLIFELERHLEQKDYRGLAKLIRVINKSFASLKFKQTQLDMIHARETSEDDCSQILQHEIYLLENKAVLEHKAAQEGLDHDDAALLGQIKHHLEQIKPRFWAIAQRLDDIYNQWEPGSWTLEYDLRSELEIWEDQKISCRRRMACCGRGCGCCEKPRHTKGTMFYWEECSHCTVECSCCIEWRQLHLGEVLGGKHTRPPLYS